MVDNNIAAIYSLLYLEHLISQSSLKCPTLLSCYLVNFVVHRTVMYMAYVITCACLGYGKRSCLGRCHLIIYNLSRCPVSPCSRAVSVSEMSPEDLFSVPLPGGQIICRRPVDRVYLLEFTSPPDNRLTTVCISILARDAFEWTLSLTVQVFLSSPTYGT